MKITYSISNTGVLTLNGSNIASGKVVNVNANTVTFGVGNTGTATNGQVKITAIEVVYSFTPACEHNYKVTSTIDATCIKEGSITEVCEKCGDKKTTTTDKIDHTTDNGTCEICGQTFGGSTTPAEPTTLATFELGTATSDDSTAISSYTEEDGEYMLSISGQKMYYGYGNGESGLKFGSSSAKGSGSFTVKSNVTKVVIYVSKYSSDSTKITINGTQYTLTNNYQAIEIEQPIENAEWTVEFSAVNSSKYRFYISTIEFIGYEN